MSTFDPTAYSHPGSKLNDEFARVPTPSRVFLHKAQVNLNVTGDTLVPVVLPKNMTRYMVGGVYVSNASESLTTVTFGVYSQAARAGIAIVTAAALSGITATTDATAANAKSMSVAATTESFQVSNTPNLYLNVDVAQGSAATADVTIELIPLP